MSFTNILYEVNDSIARITLNRPDKLNALNWQTMQEIQSAVSSAMEDENVKGVILTGAGPKAFAAGADIAELAERGAVEAKEFAMRSQEVLRTLEYASKPVIAAVNGFALGGGCELAMACHMRWASENAKFGQPEVNLGIIPGNGGTQRLPRLVGKGRAIELTISGRMIDAAEAERIGLVNHVAPQEELISTCEKFLQTVFQKGPIAVKLCLEAVNHGMDMTLEEGVNLEASLFGLAFSTEDMKVGTKAFLEKRKANFQGK